MARYGAQAGNVAESVGQTAQNVSVVYIDARGVGRRALLKRMGKGAFKAKMGKKDVVIGADLPSGPLAGSASATPGGSGRAVTPPPLPAPNRNPTRTPSPNPGYRTSVTGGVPPPSYGESMANAKPVPARLPPRSSYSRT